MRSDSQARDFVEPDDIRAFVADEIERRARGERWTPPTIE
jgi:hypothetical protein